MSIRNVERHGARYLYERFSRDWRRNARELGTYGKPKQFRRPRFGVWMALHDHDLNKMREASPSDVLEFMAAAQSTWNDEELLPTEASAEGPGDPYTGLESGVDVPLVDSVEFGSGEAANG